MWRFKNSCLNIIQVTHLTVCYDNRIVRKYGGNIMTVVFIIGAFTFIMVLVLTIFTINKGYAFKHTIDERPNNHNETNKKTHSQEG